MKVCIIGAGVTGLSLLLVLTNAGINPTDITIIDPQFECGDLNQKWGKVISNTPWSKTIDGLNKVLGCTLVPSENLTPLSDITDIFASLTKDIPVNRIKGFVTEVSHTSAGWNIQYYSDALNTLTSKTLFMAQGSDSRILSTSIPSTPSIPLECALDDRIASYISPGDEVIVFGTMHSGALVIKNLHDLSASVTAVYRPDTPFKMARDGAYDGLYGHAADIADSINAARLPVTLVHSSDTGAINRAVAVAKWAIYAMGFAPRIIPGISNAYDRVTGAIENAPNAWGFGIAYPNAAPDGINWDVSVAAFLNHIHRQLPTILNAIG